jgi:hypothetical protein
MRGRRTIYIRVEILSKHKNIGTKKMSGGYEEISKTEIVKLDG